MSVYTLILVAAFTLNAAANVLIKLGMTNMDTGQEGGLIGLILKLPFQPYFLAGIVCFMLALGAYSVVLSKMNLSVAYPVMTTMGLVIVTLASHFLFKEAIGPAHLAGIALIIGGIWLVAQ